MSGVNATTWKERTETDSAPGSRIPVKFQGLDVEAQRWRDRCDILTVKLLEDRRLTSIVQAEHQKTDLAFLAPDLFQYCKEAHAGGSCGC